MAGDPTGTVFLAGKIQVGLESGNTQQNLSNIIKSVKEEISVFNQSNKLIIDVDVQNAMRIRSLANNIRDIKSAIDSLSNVKVIWENMSTHMKSAFATANNLAVLAKDLPKVFEPLKESLMLGREVRSSIMDYADALDRIKANAGLLTTLKSKLPTVLSSVNTPSVVPGVVPAGTPGGAGAGSKAAQEYRDTVEKLHAALVNVFKDINNLDRNEFWKKNKEVIIQSFNALQKYHEETGNVFAQGQDYVKLIQMINKEGIKPSKGLMEEEKYLQGIQLLRKNGIITEAEYNGFILKRQEALKKEQDASRNALSLRAEMLRNAKRESDQEIKNVEIQHRKTVEYERQKFAKEAKRLGNTGDIADNQLAQAAIINRINNLRNSTDLADKREIINLNKILDQLTKQEVLLKNKISLTTRENELLAMMDRYLNGGTKEIKNQAGAELSKLKVSEKELLLKTAKNKLDSEHYDQLKKQLGYRRGITELFFDEMRNWPLMIARQAAYGAQWTLIFGIIHRVQAAIREGLRLYGEFERGTSRALRTGLTPTQLAGAFTPQANGGMKEAVTHYRELLNIQAMIFTSRHKASVKEYMDVIYELTSANMSLSKAMQFADTTMKVAIAAEGDMTQTARTMAGLYNIYGKTIKGVGSEQEKFNQIANTVLVTWSREQIELTELNNALKYVAASGRAIDLDYRVLVTTIGHLNTQMIRGATAGTGLRQMMSQVSKDAGGLKNAFGDFTNDLIAFSKQEKMSFDPQKPMDFIAVMEAMRKKLLANRKDFVDYGQDIVYTQKELSEVYKIMSLRGANVGLTLLRTLPEFKKKMQETLGLTKDFADNFIKIQEMNIPVQWETMLKNLAMLPAAFLMGATHTESIAQAMANINASMTNVIVGAFAVGKTISGWGDYILQATLKLDSLMNLLHEHSITTALSNVPVIGSLFGEEGIFGTGITSGRILPDLYARGKGLINKTKAEVNDPKKFMKDLGLRVDELGKYFGFTTNAQNNAEKTLDMSSKKFMENLNQRIEAANTESLTWINIGDYIRGTADSLERYTQIYKELNGAYDIGQMGKVSGEFKKQQTYIEALNKTMEGQINFYSKMKETNKAQRENPGELMQVINSNIQMREKNFGGENAEKRINKVKELINEYNKLNQFALPVAATGNIRGKMQNAILAPEFKKREDEIQELKRQHDRVSNDIINERK
ncbi:MAG TPA: phage tail tape measure protein, partial [Atribacterota bacterium]|nr:phage tail tape measure protein [Atribacterota bacterium]